MKLKNINGFSLMEMMVVLLIVAIVMAASAPMVSRKMIRVSGEGGFSWTEVTGGIFYNQTGQTVMIGEGSRPSGYEPLLYIKSSDDKFPQIMFDGVENGQEKIQLLLHNGNMHFRNHALDDSVTKSTTIGLTEDGGQNVNSGAGSTSLGFDSGAVGEKSVAVGYGATASSNESIAIGDEATADGLSSIAIGAEASVNYDDCIAIGAGATVELTNAQPGERSIAIGGTAIEPNMIVLGDSGDTVYIPGNLKVEGEVTINGNIGWDDGQLGHRAALPENTEYVYYENNPTSDRRLKNVGDVYKGGLEELKKLVFYHYTFKNDNNKTPHVGVMAQDLQKIFPDAVLKGNNGFLKIRPEYMFYAIINALKELDTKCTELAVQVKANLDLTAKLQAKVDSQEKEIVELKKLTKELEKRLAKVEK